LTGDPVTVKSAEGAANPTLVTVVGNFWPAANLMSPLLLMWSPGSAGVVDPCPNSRLSVPVAPLVLFPTGSATQRKFWGTAVLLALLNTEAVKSNCCELLPAVAIAFPRYESPR
jgi:hypothetical protein